MFGKKHQHRTTVVETTTPHAHRATHLAARVGHWSATHWKTALFGWLVFVAAAFYLGGQVGVNQIKQNEANVGESRTADRIIHDAGFSTDAKGQNIDEQNEMVLVQSKTLTVHDPAFRAAIVDAMSAARSFPQVHSLRAPPVDGPHKGLISKDGHSALIQYIPRGTYEQAVKYIDRRPGHPRRRPRRRR